MVTETEVQLLRSRINELEDRLKLLYRHLNLEYTDPGSDPMLSQKFKQPYETVTRSRRSSYIAK